MHQFSTCSRTVCGPEIPNNKNNKGNESIVLSIKKHHHRAQLTIGQRLGPTRLISTGGSIVCQPACSICETKKLISIKICFVDLYLKFHAKCNILVHIGPS
jgi:hypothetical protein